MLSLLEIPACVQSGPEPADAEVPAESEPVAPYTAADAAWWMAQNKGGCVEGDLSPEDRRIAAAMTAMEWRLDRAGEEYAALGRHEAGIGYW